MKVISHEHSERGVVKAIVMLDGTEKEAFIAEACSFICDEFKNEIQPTQVKTSQEVLREIMEPDELSAMCAAYAMGIVATKVAEELGVVSLVSPDCVARSNIFADEDFLFEETFVIRPDCTLTSYEPAVVYVKDKEHAEKLNQQRNEISDSDSPDQQEALCEEACKVISERIVEDIPEEAIEAIRNSYLDDVYRQARLNDLSLQEYLELKGLDDGALGMMLYRKAQDSLRKELALDALFGQLNIDLNDADITQAAQMMVPHQNGRALEYFKARGMLPILIQSARHEKARKWLVETCRIEVEAN